MLCKLKMQLKLQVWQILSNLTGQDRTHPLTQLSTNNWHGDFATAGREDDANDLEMCRGMTDKSISALILKRRPKSLCPPTSAGVCNEHLLFPYKV